MRSQSWQDLTKEVVNGKQILVLHKYLLQI